MVVVGKGNGTSSSGWKLKKCARDGNDGGDEETFLNLRLITVVDLIVGCIRCAQNEIKVTPFLYCYVVHGAKSGRKKVLNNSWLISFQ